ncbi:MAG: hypothetical protein AB1755_03975 [Candidatus Omnitrophota bacterium]
MKRIFILLLAGIFCFNHLCYGFQNITQISSGQLNPTLLGIDLNGRDALQCVSTGIQFNLNIPKGTILSLDQRNNLQTNINYFLTALTIDDSEFWVNLNPNQPNRLTGTNLSYTDMGKHLLLLDLKLKKDTAFSLFPGLSTGATTYWERVFAKAKQLSNRRTGELKNRRTLSIPTTFRVWIVPDKAEVYEDGKGSCVITKSTLKVLLESEYLQLPQTPSLPKRGIKGEFDNNQELQSYCEAQLKELILPNLTYKVNHDPSYESLRQIYNAIILAKWYKENVSAKGGPASGGKSQSEKLEELTNQRTDELKNAFSSIINTNNLNGLISKEPVTPQQIFAAYLDSVKQGEYHLSKTNYNEELKANIRRSYVSGGVNVTMPLSEIVAPGDVVKAFKIQKTNCKGVLTWNPETKQFEEQRALIHGLYVRTLDGKVIYVNKQSVQEHLSDFEPIFGFVPTLEQALRFLDGHETFHALIDNLKLQGNLLTEISETEEERLADIFGLAFALGQIAIPKDLEDELEKLDSILKGQLKQSLTTFLTTDASTLEERLTAIGLADVKVDTTKMPSELRIINEAVLKEGGISKTAVLSAMEMEEKCRLLAEQILASLFTNSQLTDPTQGRSHRTMMIEWPGDKIDLFQSIRNTILQYYPNMDTNMVDRIIAIVESRLEYIGDSSVTKGHSIWAKRDSSIVSGSLSESVQFAKKVLSLVFGDNVMIGVRGGISRIYEILKEKVENLCPGISRENLVYILDTLEMMIEQVGFQRDASGSRGIIIWRLKTTITYGNIHIEDASLNSEIPAIAARLHSARKRTGLASEITVNGVTLRCCGEEKIEDIVEQYEIGFRLLYRTLMLRNRIHGLFTRVMKVVEGITKYIRTIYIVNRNLLKKHLKDFRQYFNNNIPTLEQVLNFIQGHETGHVVIDYLEEKGISLEQIVKDAGINLNQLYSEKKTKKAKLKQLEEDLCDLLGIEFGRGGAAPNEALQKVINEIDKQLREKTGKEINFLTLLQTSDSTDLAQALKDILGIEVTVEYEKTRKGLLTLKQTTQSQKSGVVRTAEIPAASPQTLPVLAAAATSGISPMLQDLDLSKGLAYSEQRRRHLAYTLLDFRRMIRHAQAGSQEQRLILETALAYIDSETALLSRGVINNLTSSSLQELRLVFEYLVDVVNETITNGNIQDDFFVSLRDNLTLEQVSDTQTADNGTKAQRAGYFINRLGWNLRYIANRPIFVTNVELSTPGLAVVTEAITDERRSELQLQAAGILFEDYVVEARTTITALAIPEAQVSEDEEKPQELGIAKRVMDMFSPRNKAWPVTSLPLAQRLRTLLQEATCLTNSQRQEAFSQIALLISTNCNKEQAVRMLVNLTRQPDIQPAVLELLTYLDTETATLVFMGSFARTSDDVVSLITWLSFLDSARARLCFAQYKGTLTEEVLINLPLSCYVLAHMMETRIYKPYIAAIRTHLETEDKIAGLTTVNSLIALVDAIRQQGTVTKGQTETISFQKSIDDIEAIQTELSRSYDKLQKLKQQASVAATARTTDSDSPQQVYARELRRVSDICILGRLPADVVKALSGFAKAKGVVAFDLMVELIAVQEPQVIAIFINTLGQNQPRLAIVSYKLSDEVQCIEFLSLLLTKIDQDKAVETLDAMVNNQQLCHQGSRRLAERILLGPAIEAIDTMVAIHTELCKRDSRYNTELEFQLTGVLLAEDLTKGQREQAVKRCAQIIETTDYNWPKLKADFRVLIAMRTDPDQTRKDAITELGKIGTEEAVSVLLGRVEYAQAPTRRQQLPQDENKPEVLASLIQIANTHQESFTEKQYTKLKRLLQKDKDLEAIIVALSQAGNKVVIDLIIKDFEQAIYVRLKSGDLTRPLYEDTQSVFTKAFLEYVRCCFNPEIEQWANWRKDLINRLPKTDQAYCDKILFPFLEALGVPIRVSRVIRDLQVSNDVNKRMAIIRLFGRERNPVIVEALIKAYQDVMGKHAAETSYDDKIQEWKAIINALGRIADPATVEFLIKQLPYFKALGDSYDMESVIRTAIVKIDPAALLELQRTIDRIRANAKAPKLTEHQFSAAVLSPALKQELIAKLNGSDLLDAPITERAKQVIRILTSDKYYDEQSFDLLIAALNEIKAGIRVNLEGLHIAGDYKEILELVFKPLIDDLAAAKASDPNTTLEEMEVLAKAQSVSSKGQGAKTAPVTTGGIDLSQIQITIVG